MKQIFVFGAVATAAAAPWYARNWILAGNPFYSLRFGGFAVNPIHDAILHYYSASLGVHAWSGSTWASVLLPLLLLAMFQVLAGIPGGFRRFRQHGYLIVIALLLVAVWIQSIGYTSGGAEGSTRVLSPALVVLSITGAGLLEPLTRSNVGGGNTFGVVTAGRRRRARSIRTTLFPCAPANGRRARFRALWRRRNFKSATSWCGFCRQGTACFPTVPISTPH